MRAHTRPGVVRLSWDTRSKLLRDATGAVVWIADGSEESKLELTGDQVRAGSIEYVPFAPNVNFRMQVGQFMESLSVEAALLPPKTTDSPPLVVASNPSPSAQSAHRVRRTRLATRKLAPPRPVQGSSAERARTANTVADDPPPPQIALAPARLERPPCPNSHFKFLRCQRPWRSQAHRRSRRYLGGWYRAARKTLCPLELCDRCSPKSTSNEPTSVAVRVEIDQKGIVRDADLLTKRVDGDLGRSAVEAAKRWRFEPARQEDRPVESSMVVKFQFGGEKN